VREVDALRYPTAALATPHYLASAAGAAELARGGNAVDAIIAANLALGVVSPYFCGYGGDIFAIVWDGELHGYLGSGRSPAAATVEAVSAQAGVRDMPIVGPHTVTVPGAPAGWFDLLARWGTRSFHELIGSGVSLARDGFALTPQGAVSCAGYAMLYDPYEEWGRVYGGLEAGDTLRQPGIARLLELLAADGPDAYYRGPVADAIVAALGALGGLMAPDDLAAHEGRFVEPLVATYRDRQIAQLPPPTQGVTPLEILGILEGFDLASMDPSDRAHVMVEAVRIGLADRDEHVGDPDAMARAPQELLDPAYLAARRGEIDITRARSHPLGRPQVGGTAYLCAADRDGLLVSLIQSNFLAFGSGVHVPEWGINLNNRGSSFTFAPGAVNRLGPRKLPMHTLIPAMVLRDGRPELVFGSMGGDAQAQVHAQVLTQFVDDGADPQAAISAPRWRFEPLDGRVRVERRMDPAVVAELAARGHAVEETFAYDTGMGHAHAIRLDPHGYAAAVDPRSEGLALGA
jgi:gamma-glutamyltranspeptidase/glutathione hydrolase